MKNGSKFQIWKRVSSPPSPFCRIRSTIGASWCCLCSTVMTMSITASGRAQRRSEPSHRAEADGGSPAIDFFDNDVDDILLSPAVIEGRFCGGIIFIGLVQYHNGMGQGLRLLSTVRLS
eukprot:scaffold2208_cov170-Ochromonas_danica.AAC.19